MTNGGKQEVEEADHDVPTKGGLHFLKPPERLSMPQSCARSREIPTGGQRSLMARNLRIKHLDGPGRDDLPFLTGGGRHVWQPQVIASLWGTDHRTCGWRQLIAQIGKGRSHAW